MALMVGIIEYEAVGNVIFGRGNRSARRKLALVHFIHHKSHMTRSDLESGPRRWEADD